MPLDVAEYIIRESICAGCATFVTAEQLREEMKLDGYNDTPQCAIPPTGPDGIK